MMKEISAEYPMLLIYHVISDNYEAKGLSAVLPKFETIISYNTNTLGAVK